jgi:hypothetical protein
VTLDGIRDLLLDKSGMDATASAITDVLAERLFVCVT